MSDKNLSAERLVDFWRDMHRIRAFERAAIYQSSIGKIYGALHSYEGQESCAVAVCAALRQGDHVASTHRGHGHCIAMGASPARMMAELFGRIDGYCKGKGGSLHIADMGVGMLGANGIVGAGSPIAVGAAFAHKYKNDGNVAVAFFGDGSTNIGAFHEAANMACALKLPIVFACENNEYGEFTRRDHTMAITDIVDRAQGYGMPGVIVDGMDAIAVYETAAEAIAFARAGKGPTLIEAKTYRFYNHHGIQNLGLKYRPDAEVEMWKQRDPIFSLETKMAASGAMSSDQAAAVWAELRADIADAIQFAEDSPLPNADQLLEDVYTSMTGASMTGAGR